jgi:hypothetical protein
MFVELATALTPVFGGNATVAADAVLTGYRPSQLADFLELYWHQGITTPAMFLGAPNDLIAVPDHQESARTQLFDAVPPGPPPPAPGVIGPGWNHLAYAFCLDQTRMYDIFRRVVFEYAQGERLPHASQATQRWLRATEELFFSPPRLYSVRAVTSYLRPDESAVRRNAYYRLLGMDLTHGSEDGRPYPYVKSEIANNDFATLFEALLAEVWKGYSNRLNFVGENGTDDEAIATLVRRLQEMLQARRFAGTLSREEFDAVATMSWFHLTVLVDSQIIADLSAQAAGAADRLKKVGDRVGLSAHSRADAYFQLAYPLSNILRNIENGAVTAAGPVGLYNGIFTADMLTITTNWSIATGRELKDAGQRQPIGRVLLNAVRAPANGAPVSVPSSRIPTALMR